MKDFSPKDLRTLEYIKSDPSEWELTPVKWVKEKRMMRVKVDCEVCYGRGATYVNLESGKVAKDADYKNINNKEWRAKNTYKECPVCPPSRGRAAGHRSTGKVWVEKLVEVTVGYPQWAKGTIFDWSRFADCDCELCGKKIKKTNLVPVMGKDKDGQYHGMWVGIDCARKFPIKTDDLKGIGTKKVFEKGSNNA